MANSKVRTLKQEEREKETPETQKLHEQGEMKAPERFREIGSTGLEHWSGRVTEEWLKELSQDDKRWKVYREMRDNDPLVGAIFFAIDMIIRQVEWRVQPASDNDDDVKAAEFVESCMEDMSQSWESTISEILSFLQFGYSYHEIVYKRRMGKTKDPSTRSKYDDGYIGWRKLPLRSQRTLDRWVFDETGGVKAFVQNDYFSSDGARATIPIAKALLFRTSSHKNNPEGRSILRNAFRPWFFKKRIEEIEGIGIERDLAGLPVIYAPNKIMAESASDDEKAIFTAVKDIVRNIRRDEQEGIVMPGDRDDKGHRYYELELLSTGGTRQFDTDKIIQRYDQRIAMTVLSDFILIGHEKVGSFALSSNKTALFSTALGAWLNEISSVFNRFAIPRLFDVNGFDVEEYPTLEYGDIESPNLKELGEYISKLSGAGATLFPNSDLENALLGAANLPEKPEDEYEDMVRPTDTGTVSTNKPTPEIPPASEYAEEEKEELEEENEDAIRKQ